MAFTPREMAEGVLGTGWPSGLTVFVGVCLVGVGLTGVVVLDFTGVAPVVVLAVVLGFDTGVVVVSFLTAAGFAVVVVGFEALLIGVFVVVTGVFLTGVGAVPADLLADPIGSVFCVPIGVRSFFTGVAFAGVVVFAAAGVEVDALAGVEVRGVVEFSFFGTLFTGAGVASVVAVVDAAGFLTGVALVVDVAALVGVAVVFFAVVPAP